MNMTWPKRFLIIVVASVIGYLLVLHAGMSSDTDEHLKWYYTVEFFVAAVLCLPVAIYLGFKELFGFGSNILGMEILVIQIIGYLIFFKLYDKHKRK